MKNLLVCLAVLAAFTAGAQSSAPWNPDANNDSYVGATDMLSTLAVYGQQVGIDSSLTCDYDGTPLEEFVAGVWDATIILDSVLFQYHVLDSGMIYMAGCPDPVWEVVDIERAYWTYGINYSPMFQHGYVVTGTNFLGWRRQLRFHFNTNNGNYSFLYFDEEMSLWADILGTDHSGTISTQLPFPSTWGLDEMGIHLDTWGGWVSSTTYLSILPYWHYAE
jgi:hypothetical protein